MKKGDLVRLRAERGSSHVAMVIENLENTWVKLRWLDKFERTSIIYYDDLEIVEKPDATS
tara:strand:- start:213 stop:392 length:180 start_codon:yes stop_codon:yes gene_type:complete